MQMSWEPILNQAQSHAQAGRFDDMLVACQKLIESFSENSNALLNTGTLLLSFGYLSQARACFESARTIVPNDMPLLANLANLAREAGDHAQSRELYTLLAKRLPNHPVIRRNALVSLEYDPNVTAAERFTQAKAWGEWAVAQAGGPRPRPLASTLGERPLRIGYVSADFCQHTVGLFVMDVIKAHDPARVSVISYYSGQVNDWVTDAIRKSSLLHDVKDLDDTALAEQIRLDKIDVLIDLSGHTAGSRLTMFALRPAPLQLSWLGYFATTGLACMDATILDQWHAPHSMEEQFVEPIIRLPKGRFCYHPVPWAPTAIAPAPCFMSGYITFGCFNNSAKLNENVFDLWAQILLKVPDARLVLKWRTFADDELSQSVRSAFKHRGIDPARIELRGASFHADVLVQYGDIDIALDPFPFTGGLTSCEALWMGVPVITWAQSQVVSRQTFAFLSAIGLPELAAFTSEDYVRIAVELAQDKRRLDELRNGLRTRMLDSPLMDVEAFARQLEDCFRESYTTIIKNEDNCP
jgi:predicted O-linked N-acetylglucosamine transferase (SPINDLY family)